jgi:hypothetical protein
MFENRIIKDIRPRYRIIKEGNFFFLPEEVYSLDQSLFPSILVKNNSFIKTNTKITSSLFSLSAYEARSPCRFVFLPSVAC